MRATDSQQDTQSSCTDRTCLSSNHFNSFSGCHHLWWTEVWLTFSPFAAAAAKSLQSCLTLCDPIDGSPPGKNTGVGCHFLLQCMKVKVKSLSPVQLLVTPWTAAHQAPLSMGFSRQEYWSGVPSPSLVKGSSVVNKGDVYNLLEISFFYDPENVGNLILGCSAFSKPNMYIWNCWFLHCWSLAVFWS